ncbi:MAG: ribose 5-phosphate isomerase [Mycobacterium sp.]|jgi:hypothetical protein|nr:ribose 5-phosphate isomerase [Mycobacterium sp.]
MSHGRIELELITGLWTAPLGELYTYRGKKYRIPDYPERRAAALCQWRGMRVVVGAEQSTEVSDAIVRRVAKLGHDVVQMSGLGWADVGLGVARIVSDGDAAYGIALCGNGAGVTIAANKVSDVTSSLVPRCADSCRSAEMSRR